MQSIRPLPILATLVLSTLASACLTRPEPPPPPFRIEIYGPGLEVTRNGALVTLRDDEGEAIGRLRVASHSLRAQESNAVPIGRIRIAKDGWVFSNRAGADVCVLPDSPTPPFRIECEEEHVWTATPQHDGVSVQPPTGDEIFVPLRDDEVTIQSAGQPWSKAAYAMVHRAFESELDDQSDVAAYTLLAWALRHTETPVPPKPEAPPAPINDAEAVPSADAQE